MYKIWEYFGLDRDILFMSNNINEVIKEWNKRSSNCPFEKDGNFIRGSFFNKETGSVLELTTRKSDNQI